MSENRHRGVWVLCCFSDVKGNITGHYVAFCVLPAAPVSACLFPCFFALASSPFPRPHSRRFLHKNQPSRIHGFLPFSCAFLPVKTSPCSLLFLSQGVKKAPFFCLLRIYCRLFPVSKPVNPESCTKFHMLAQGGSA